MQPLMRDFLLRWNLSCPWKLIHRLDSVSSLVQYDNIATHDQIRPCLRAGLCINNSPSHFSSYTGISLGIKGHRIRCSSTSDPASTCIMSCQLNNSATANISPPMLTPTPMPSLAVLAPAPTPCPCPNLHLHLSQPQPKDACCYSGLSLELRQMIIDEIVEVFKNQHRFIQLRFGSADRRVLVANTPNPLPLFLCKESRLGAFRHYVRLDEPGSWTYTGSNEHMKPVYIFPDHDTIAFCPVQGFGAEGDHNWGVHQDPIHHSITLYGSGYRELNFYLDTALLLGRSRDNIIKSLALRPGEAPICIHRPRCRCAKRFHTHWGMWSYDLKRFRNLQKLIIFHEYHSPNQTSRGHPIPVWTTIPKFERALRNTAVKNSYRNIVDDRVRDIRAVDSRCMPAPGEHFELTEENLTTKRRSLGNGWRVVVPEIPDTEA
ncbi:hypothetical protein BKA64DRAFT_5243 [Cadophora sp. MPI-SDFR-AT-0126]|nr:hypothetical protein BKA64DRAFT_5243 [Leotiomycetes sp. MPI-SDFR-AT-0126]